MFPSSVGEFGSSLAGLSDINGNGSGEIVVGTVHEGRVYVFDGLTRELLAQLPFRDRTTITVQGTCDVDSDGTPEIVLSENRGGDSFPMSGVVFFVNPVSQETVLSIESPNPMVFGNFGSSLSCAFRSLEGPFHGVLIGANGENAKGAPELSGRAYFFLMTEDAPHGDSDINQDGIVDYLDLMILMEDWKRVSGG